MNKAGLNTNFELHILMVKKEKQSRYKFELLERKRYRMSWGPATVFIHRRLSDDGKPLPPYRLNVLPSDAITYEEEVSKSTYGADSDLYPPPNVTVTKQPSPQYSASKYDYMDDEDDDDDDDDDADGDDEEDDDEVGQYLSVEVVCVEFVTI